MDGNSVHFSSQTNEWHTPQDFFDRLDAEFHFTLDAAATPENTKCPKYFTEEIDGLAQSWAGETVFVNPPYGRGIGEWIKKAFIEGQRTTVVMLIPARTDTKAWHKYIFGTAEIRFIEGRMNFGGGTANRRGHNAPFPCAVVIFGSANHESQEVSK